MSYDYEKLFEEKRISELGSIMRAMSPQDIVPLLEEAPENLLPVLFRILPKGLAAETFVEMDADMQRTLIHTFSDRELRDVFDDLYLDDTVDILEEMPANVVKRILQHTDSATRRQINEILRYPRDSAGSIMTTEYVSLRPDMTVADAFNRIRKTGVDKETIYTCYVTGDDRKLLGVVSVKTLLLSDKDARIADIMNTKLVYAQTKEDKEEVARKFDKYNFLALPVVDDESRLVGIITVDDAIDVLREESTEDIEVMAAITPGDRPYLKTGVLQIWKRRIPWLLLLMISAAFTGRIIGAFEGALQAYVVLTAFIPMLMDTGGNAGSQASATIIRGLSLGDVRLRDGFSVLWKELRVAFLCGTTLAAANFIKLMLIDKVQIEIALVVGITLVAAVLVAKIVGGTLPMLAKWIGFDPAVMASPFITTIVDAISLLIYFQTASLLLNLS